MNREEIIAYARLHYPLGTIFMSLYNSGCKRYVNDYRYEYVDALNMFVSGNYVYYKGKWTDIIYSPSIQKSNLIFY